MLRDQETKDGQLAVIFVQRHGRSNFVVQQSLPFLLPNGCWGESKPLSPDQRPCSQWDSGPSWNGFLLFRHPLLSPPQLGASKNTKIHQRWIVSIVIAVFLTSYTYTFCFFFSPQSFVCHLGHWKGQETSWMHRDIQCNESALWTQGICSDEVITAHCCLKTCSNCFSRSQCFQGFKI